MRFLFFSVGLTVNHRGSGFMISQTIRGENTPLHAHVHSNPNSLTHIWTPGVHKHTYYTRETWRRHTHTHTPNTHSNLGRPQGLLLGLFLFTNILTLVLQMWHTHQQTVKYTSHQQGWDTGVGLCYIHLAQQKGWKQYVSIAHCGTFQGDKKVKLGIVWTKLKLHQTLKKC